MSFYVNMPTYGYLSLLPILSIVSLIDKYTNATKTTGRHLFAEKRAMSGAERNKRLSASLMEQTAVHHDG